MGSLDLFLGVAQILSGLYTMSGKYNRVKNNPINEFELDLSEKSDGGLKAKIYTVNSINSRVKKILEVIDRAKKNPRVRAMAVKIVSKKCGDKHCIKEKDYYNEAKAVFEWVRNAVRYVHDVKGIDTFQHPLRTIEFGGGDCDDFSILLASLYSVLGYPVKLKVIRTKNADDFNHIYVLVGIPPNRPDKEWIPVDGSVSKPFGWEAPKSMVAEYKLYKV